MVDYYNLLQVAPDAAPEAIRAAYRREAKRWHPDAHPRSTGPEREAVERRFILISQAYDTLSDPARRRDYDRRRGAEAAAASSGGPRTHESTSGAGTRAKRPRADQAGTRAGAEPGWNSLLSEVEGLLAKFGLDLKQPTERLMETMLGWARALFADFLSAWREDGSGTASGATRDPPTAGAETWGTPRPQGRPSPGARPDRTRAPEIEAELAELKRRAAEKKPAGRSDG